MSDRSADSRVGRTVLAAFASLALVAATAAPSVAASSAPAKASTSSVATSDATDFSAAKRRHYRRGPNGAALAIMGAATGVIAGAIAQSQRQEYYDDGYYAPGPGPGYYGGPAYAPAPAPYYGRPYGGYGGGPVYHDPRVWGDPRY